MKWEVESILDGDNLLTPGRPLAIRSYYESESMLGAMREHERLIRLSHPDRKILVTNPMPYDEYMRLVGKGDPGQPYPTMIELMNGGNEG